MRRRLPRRVLDRPHHVVAVHHHPDGVVERPTRPRQGASVHRLCRIAVQRADPQRRRHIGRTGPQRHDRRHLLAGARHGRRGLVEHLAERAGHPRGPLAVQRHQRSAHQRVQARGGTVGRAGVGGGHVGGVPAVGEAIVQRRAVGVDHVRPVDTCPRQRPNDLCRKQLPAVRVSRRQIFQVDAGTAVATAHPGLAAVGTHHRATQPERRTEQIAHRVVHLRTRAGDQLADQFGGQLVGVGDRDVARIGYHGLAGGIGEVQRVALVGRLKLLPVKENAVGQPVDAPPAGRLDQFDRTGIGQRTLAGLEDSDIRQRARGCRRAW